MSPRTIAELVRRDAPLIFQDQSVDAAVELLLGSELPALPAVDDRQRFVGIFGER